VFTGRQLLLHRASSEKSGHGFVQNAVTLGGAEPPPASSRRFAVARPLGLPRLYRESVALG
jgi:hypothetical protein